MSSTQEKVLPKCNCGRDRCLVCLWQDLPAMCEELGVSYPHERSPKVHFEIKKKTSKQKALDKENFARDRFRHLQYVINRTPNGQKLAKKYEAEVGKEIQDMGQFDMARLTALLLDMSDE